MTNTDPRPDPPIADVDAWLREHLGRRLTVAPIAADGHLPDDARRLLEALGHHAEIRVLAPDDAPNEAASPQEWLDALAPLDPEVVLVCVAGPGGEGETESDATQGRADALRRLLDELDRRGIFDRAFVALLGPSVTRGWARRLGFEDGFPADTVPATLARILAREGVAVDERRRRGSSPPCYL